MVITTDYYTITSFTEFDLEIKRSKFFARCSPVSNREEAMAFISQCKSDYPDARHHCWAYLTGLPENPKMMAFSDDGEPSSTAGKPILAACQGKGVSDLCLVVVRYFGGVKLGTGGLIRAYGSAASKVLESASLLKVKPKQHFRVEGGYHHEQLLRHWLSTRAGSLSDVHYLENVVYSGELETQHISELKLFLAANHMKWLATN